MNSVDGARRGHVKCKPSQRLAQLTLLQTGSLFHRTVSSAASGIWTSMTLEAYMGVRHRESVRLLKELSSAAWMSFLLSIQPTATATRNRQSQPPSCGFATLQILIQRRVRRKAPERTNPMLSCTAKASISSTAEAHVFTPQFKWRSFSAERVERMDRVDFGIN